MGKMKEMDILAEQCSIEIIDKMYRTCDWALTGPFTGFSQDMNKFFADKEDTHSYLMQLVVIKSRFIWIKSNFRS